MVGFRGNPWRTVIGLAALVLLIPACAGDGYPTAPEDDEFDNAVFSHVNRLIEISQPAMNSTTTTTPSFAWRATGRRFVYVGVFEDNIVVRDRDVVNVQDNIWAWHTGLGTSNDGGAEWADGVDVVDGRLRVGSPPTPLAPDRDYVWAVWAWDNAGFNITHSSVEVFFTTE
jgi:hypothetical protein